MITTDVPAALVGMPTSSAGLTRGQLRFWLARNDRNSTWASGECDSVGEHEYCSDDDMRACFDDLAREVYGPCGTLTYAEAHELVDACAQMGALSYLAAHWDLAGSWNENSEYPADGLHQHVDDCALMLANAGHDTRDGTNPSGIDDDSDTGLSDLDMSDI